MCTCPRETEPAAPGALRKFDCGVRGRLGYDRHPRTRFGAHPSAYSTECAPEPLGRVSPSRARAGDRKQLMAEPTNIFPATSATWLESQVRCADEPARERARRHVMAVYFHPLVVYVKGSSYRGIGDADDLVAGFFADRLERGDYLEKWLVSGAPLRAWLMRVPSRRCAKSRARSRGSHRRRARGSGHG